MKLIIGLGNPGKEYENTRHNIGFALLDIIAEELKTEFKEKSKFKSLVAEAEIENEKVLLIKPTTFYNLVGESARAVRDFYKLENSDILAIHDDMALPFGTIRTRFGGRDAGNNGVKSLNQHLGAAFARVRVGVWNLQRETINAHDFVLAKFPKEDQKIIAEIVAPAIKNIARQHAGNVLEAHSQKLVRVSEPKDALQDEGSQRDDSDTDN